MVAGVVLTWLTISGSAWAQPGDPFGVGADPFGGGSDPFGGPGVSAPAAATPTATASADGLSITTDHGTIRLEADPRDPSVQIYRDRLLRPGRTPSPPEFVQAALILARTGQPNEAKFYLAKFQTLSPTDDDLIRLHRGLSTAGLQALRDRKNLQPFAGEIVEQILAGTKRYYSDANRLRGWVVDLSDANASVRGEAFTSLRAAGPQAFPVIFSVWANPDERARHAGIRVAARQWFEMREPLLAALQASDSEFVAQVLDVLQDHSIRRDLLPVAVLASDASADPSVRQGATALLNTQLGRVPERAEIGRALDREIASLGQQATALRQTVSSYDTPDPETVWRWSADANTVDSANPLAADALSERVAVLTKARARLSPSDPFAQRTEVLGLAETLPIGRPVSENGAADGGNSSASVPLRIVPVSLSSEPGEGRGSDTLDPPAVRVARVAVALDDDPSARPAVPAGATERERLETLARSLPVRDLEAIFREALQSGQDRAAANLAYLLAERPFEDVLVTGPDRMPALAMGLRSPSAEVRFATADAIASRPIPAHFAGASFLASELASFASADSTPVVITCHPKTEAARTWAASLASLGYSTLSATTGADLYRLASQRSDIEWLVIDETVSEPALTELMQWLRKDERTARLPVVVMAGLYSGERETTPFYLTPAGAVTSGPALEAAGVVVGDPAAPETQIVPTLSVTERINHPAVRLAQSDSRLLVMPRSKSPEDFLFVLGRLTDRQLLRTQPTVVRRDRAARAVDHLITLASRSDQLFEDDLIRHEAELIRAAGIPDVALAGYGLLGELGTQNAQRHLLSVVSQTFRPQIERRAALTAWRQAVADHGVMLTAAEIRSLTASATIEAAPDAVTLELLEFIKSGGSGAVTSLSPPVVVGPQSIKRPLTSAR